MCNLHLVVVPGFLLTLGAASHSADESTREANIQQIAGAYPTQEAADPCATATSLTECHYARALGMLQKFLPPSKQDPSKAQDVALALCSLVTKGNEYCKVREQALQRVVEILEGRPLWSKKLFDIIGNIEELLDTMRPGSIASFRRTHLVSAINAKESNPSDAERAQEALQILESMKWPNGSIIDQVINGLREVVQSSSPSWYHSAKSRLSNLWQKTKDRVWR